MTIHADMLADLLFAVQGEFKRGITFVKSKSEETFLSYGELLEQALLRWEEWQRLGIVAGAELVLQVEDQEQFIITFWAAVVGGCVPIPFSVRVMDMDEHMLVLQNILATLENPIVLTDCPEIINTLPPHHKIIPIAPIIKSFAGVQGTVFQKSPLAAGGKNIAFIQYSSGSTGTPKGVVLSATNVLANIRAILSGIRARYEDVSLSWMPLTHDMGLIGFHLVPLAAGVPQVLLPVELFVRHPLLWMEKVSQHQATVLGSPDFGMKLFLGALKEHSNYDWQLAQVRIIFNGAEPVFAETCRKFSTALLKYGLQPHVLFPVYGLAEATLAVTFPAPGEPVQVITVSRQSLAVGEEVIYVGAEAGEDATPLVALGGPVAGCQVRIIDDLNLELTENRLGHIVIRGENVTGGYYRNEEETTRAFTADGWLRTGDLGFWWAGQLVVAGRVKEMVVVNGLNIYLPDLERIAGETLGIDTRKIVCCPLDRETNGGEIIGVFVVWRRDSETFLPLAQELRRVMLQKTGVTIGPVIPVARIPKTTSGKRKRYELARRYHEGEFTPVQQVAPVVTVPQAGSVEAQLLDILHRQLGVTGIGVEDNLSHFGLNSLKLPPLHDEVEQLFPGLVKLTDYYRFANIAAMSAWIRAQQQLPRVAESLSKNTTIHRQTRKEGMKKLALLFPGQGSQHVGMGQDLCTYFPVASRAFEEASDILQQDIKRLCFAAELEELTRTENAQPAILTVSVAKYRVFQQELGIVPCLGAGHSLGEYSALVCGNALTFREGLLLVKQRGRLMAQASQMGNGSMSAISGLHKNAVLEECRKIDSENHRVVVANINAATQVVISGHTEALAKAHERLTALGARVVPLHVSAAFHSPLMEPSAQEFARELSRYHFKMPDWPIISNVTAQPYPDKASIPLLLQRQLTAPILWADIMEYIKAQAVTTAIELGPKKVLKNLFKKSSRDITVYSANTQSDLLALQELNPVDFVDKRPNLLERCLAMAVSTVNRNFDESAYQVGVIEPYRRIHDMFYRLQAEKRDPEPHHLEEAVTLLKQIFATKGVPVAEQSQRLQHIFQEISFTPSMSSTLSMSSIPSIEIKRQDAASTNIDIAVIGVSLRTSLAENVGQFWQNLVAGRDCTREIPDDRQNDIDDYLPHLFKIKLDEASRTSKKRYLTGGYLEHIDRFDYRFFRLSPKEASLLDPCQRVFLEEAYHVLEDAGYAGRGVMDSDTGVYVGYSDDVKLNYFQMISQMEPESIAQAIAGNLSSIVPTRISYFMDLKGPGILVDTACSSSLVAIHLACQAIRSGDCEQAIAGGVRIQLVPLIHTAKVGFESSDGKTRTFDDDSDGVGSGEGAAAVLLKPLDNALRDSDHIYAVIKGSAMNQDGQSLGITAPSADAQTRVLIKAWKNAGINPETLSYIETHGTGTRVGDPIEVEALTAAFKQFTNKKQFCAVGSVKPNIGHLFEASGIFGFIKAVLSLEKKVLPPLLFFNRPNRHISFEQSALYIQDQLTPWNPQSYPRRCGVTAFGFSGTNCHIVLEEFPQHTQNSKTCSEGRKYCFPLSAKSKEALHSFVHSYQEFLATVSEDQLASLCFTAGIGRGHFTFRLALIVESVAQLQQRFQQLASDGVGEATGIYYGEVGKTSTVTLFAPDEDPEVVARHYVSGVEPDWQHFYRGSDVHRLSLPLYPFEANRCWLDIPTFAEHTQKPLEGKLFFDMVWVEERLPEPEEPRPSTGLVLLVRDKDGLGQLLAQELVKTGSQVVEILPGIKFAPLAPYCFQVDGSEAHYEKVLLALAGLPVARVIFLAGSQPAVTSLTALFRCQKQGTYPLFHLTKMLLKHYSTDKMEYIVITNYVHAITTRETCIKPENAPLMGLTYAIDQECENITTRCIDMDDTMTLDQLVAEIQAPKQYRLAAYREGHRYVERFVPLEIEKAAASPVEFVCTGVYMITGGTGGIGLEMGQYLATKAPGITIALINRSPMPASAQWDEILEEEEDKSTCKKITAIREMEALGARVILKTADCAVLKEMKAVFTDLRARFGRINGIIHGAGVEGEGLLVRKSEQKFANVLNPKVAGTWILDHLSRVDKLDFLILFSSVATFLMNVGQTDYTAANAYLDAFSQYRNRRGQKTIAVNWVTWKETGMAVHFNVNFDIIFKAIPTAQAVAALDILIQKKVTRVLVGELNIHSKLVNLLKNAQFQLDAPIRSIIDTPDLPAKTQSLENQRKKARAVKLTGHEDGQYSQAELLVARVWGEVLGFDEFKVTDNFYELGGDSILATQVVNRLNSENNLKIALIEIFNYETIKELAQYVEKQIGERSE